MEADRILDDISHRRYNPLTGSWILVSPHRTKRPWQGAQENPSPPILPAHDPECYLCPGNPRVTGDVMPNYTNTSIFINDFSAVRESQPLYKPPRPRNTDTLELLQAQGVKGRCYVITFSPKHNATLADLSHEALLSIIATWTSLYTSHLPSSHAYFAPAPPDLGVVPPRDQYDYLQIFENKGAAMGCSNPHPHGQAWCTSGLPGEVSTELQHLTAYKKTHDGRGLLADYVHLELQKKERIVFHNSTWVALCPWWAVWPFETMLIPRREIPSLPALTREERDGLAEALSQITKRYDNLFQCSFPYSMGIHQAPLSGEAEEIAHLHLHFYPPLLRSASVRKFLVGYELMAEPQRDITPEQAAERLRNLDGTTVYRGVL
ncbi:galactose-1-phosphate uridyl transferase [Sphaerosporella brunnea]|uniref:Galactose-1-phosphate uridylyltransferase n=1 Tax=Sphaerosporella brunnea TaxID=1250544 RepID=A0A5J5ET44_9PEZI|nr:galactose-1-phosphate uridyl transferase [Sphaerosporella brunnea]